MRLSSDCDIVTGQSTTTESCVSLSLGHHSPFVNMKRLTDGIALDFVVGVSVCWNKVLSKFHIRILDIIDANRVFIEALDFCKIAVD